MKWISLPNGMIVAGINRLNTLALYEEIFVHDIYGKTGVDIAAGDFVIDVGANIGLFALWAKQRANCRLCCFEPAPEVFEALQTNVKPWHAACVAMSDRPGTIPFTYYPRLPELSTALPGMYAAAERREWIAYLRRRVRANPLGRLLPACVQNFAAACIRRYLFKPRLLSVPATTLADIIRRIHVPVGLVKIDVEKSELRVLSGIDDCWDRIRQIIVECYDGPAVTDNVARVLRANGFNVARFDNTMFPELRTPLIVGRRAA